MPWKILSLVLLAIAGIALAGCASTPKAKFDAWLPRFSEACRKVSEARTKIEQAPTVEEKLKIKRDSLDPLRQTLGDLQKELKEIMKTMPAYEQEKCKTSVMEILARYRIG